MRLTSAFVAALLSAPLAAPAVLAQGLSPEGISLWTVQRQVDAYNRNDAAAFAATYAPDAEIFVLGPSAPPIMSGRPTIQAKYGEMFKTGPHTVTVTARTARGAFVIDQEVVKTGDKTDAGIAVYEIQNSLIRRVWITP